MKHAIDPGHGAINTFAVTDIADEIPHIRTAQSVAQHILLFLIPAEDADLGAALGEQILEHGLAEGAGTAGDENYFIQSLLLDETKTSRNIFSFACISTLALCSFSKLARTSFLRLIRHSEVGLDLSSIKDTKLDRWPSG